MARMVKKLSIESGILTDLKSLLLFLEESKISTSNQEPKFFTLEVPPEPLFLMSPISLVLKEQSMLLNSQTDLVEISSTWLRKELMLFQ